MFLCYDYLINTPFLYHLSPASTEFPIRKAVALERDTNTTKERTPATAHSDKGLSLHFERVGGWGTASWKSLCARARVSAIPTSWSRWIYGGIFIVRWHLRRGNHMAFLVLELLLDTPVEEKRAVHVLLCFRGVGLLMPCFARVSASASDTPCDEEEEVVVARHSRDALSSENELPCRPEQAKSVRDP